MTKKEVQMANCTT